MKNAEFIGFFVPVEGKPHEHAFRRENIAPFAVYKRSVGLYAYKNATVFFIELFYGFECAYEKLFPRKQWFAALKG